MNPPNRIGLLQLESGLAGDMLMGALAGAGADFEAMRRAVAAATGGRADLERKLVMRRGLEATKVDVVIDGTPLKEDPGHLAHGHGTSWKTIDAALESSGLDAALKEASRRAFHRLAVSEARMHGTDLDRVHFHELGGLDAVADIVGALAGLHTLSLDALYHGPVHVGGGSVRTEHGLLPVPAPATLDLMEGRDLVMSEGKGELLTPTGAVLLATCARPRPDSLAVRPEVVGLGAGTRDLKDRPNAARLIVGASGAAVHAGDDETVGVVEAHLDDCSPEDLGYVTERFLEQGALDAAVIPMMMKKSRPGFLLRLLVPASEARDWADRVVDQTTSLGARYRVESRRVASRRTESVELPEGRFRVKVSESGGDRIHVEFEDLREAARKTGEPIDRLRRRVERAWESRR